MPMSPRDWDKHNKPTMKIRNKFLALLLGATLALGALGGTAQAAEAEDTGPGEVVVQVECEAVTVHNRSPEVVLVGQSVAEAVPNDVAPGKQFVLVGSAGVEWYVYSDTHGFLQEGVFTECVEPDPEPVDEDEDEDVTETTEPEAPGVRVEDRTEPAPEDDAAETTEPETGDEVLECEPEAATDDDPVVDADAATLPFTGIEPWMIYAAATLTLSGIVALVFGKRKVRI